MFYVKNNFFEQKCFMFSVTFLVTRKCSIKRYFSKKLMKFIGKKLYQSLFSIKLQAAAVKFIKNNNEKMKKSMLS